MDENKILSSVLGFVIGLEALVCELTCTLYPFGKAEMSKSLLV